MFRTYRPNTGHLAKMIEQADALDVPAKILIDARAAVAHAQQLDTERRALKLEDPTSGLAGKLASGDITVSEAVKIVSKSADPEVTRARAKRVLELAVNGAVARATAALSDAAPGILDHLDSVVQRAATQSREAGPVIADIRDGDQAMTAGADIRAAWGVVTDSIATVSEARRLAHDLRSYGLSETDGPAYEDGRYSWDRPADVPLHERRENDVHHFIRSLDAGPRVRTDPAPELEPLPPRDPELVGHIAD